VFNFPGTLYAITPDQADTQRLVGQVRTALEAGVRLVQYRDKISTMADKLTRGRTLNQLCQAFDAQLIINDDVVLTIAIGAAGVHLGGDDGSIRDARRLLPANSIIGASCYNNLNLARTALADGASYVAFGACFDSPTKPAALRVNLDQLQSFRDALGSHVAICGIGGITHRNLSEICGLVDAVALISELFGSPEAPHTPEQIKHRIQQLLAEPALL
jgi:thiamine-phosphate pyrophosphorylase